MVHEINDISFVAVDHPELGIGYDLWVGGALSTAPRLAERLGVFVTAGGGARRLARRGPHLPRLRLPPAAQQGPPEVPARRLGHGEVPRGSASTEYLGYELPDGVAPPSPASLGLDERGDHVGVHEQHDGRFYIGAAPTVGRVSGETLASSPTSPRRTAAAASA